MSYRLTVDDVIKVGKEYSTKGASELARELKVSNARIFQVVQQLRKKGVSIAKPNKNTGVITEAAAKLRNI